MISQGPTGTSILNMQNQQKSPIVQNSPPPLPFSPLGVPVKWVMSCEVVCSHPLWSGATFYTFKPHLSETNMEACENGLSGKQTNKTKTLKI